jgi:hypothetical protein
MEEGEEREGGEKGESGMEGDREWGFGSRK